MLTARVALIISVFALILSAWTVVKTSSVPPPETRVVYAPGLGEFMTAVQMRHAKLGIAGAEGNWDLAHYELGELREAFEDVVKFQPTHEGVPRPLAEMVSRLIDPPLKSLDAAIASRNVDGFTAALDTLTAGCNACHTASTFGFNRVVRPTAPPVTNQDFKPTP